MDSSHVRDDVQEILGVPPDRVRVVPLGISKGFTRRSAGPVEQFLRERKLPSAYLLYVGARKKHKNLALVIDALGRLPRSERLPLVLSGPAWRLSHPLSQRAQRAGISSCIHFTGPLHDDEDLALLYSGAALYLQPSLDEGFGDAAALLPPSEPEVWAESMTELLNNSVRREDLIRKGLVRARAFTWERTAELTMGAYAEVLGSA